MEWKWACSLRYVDTDVDRARWRSTLNYRLLRTLQIGVEYNLAVSEFNPLATWFLTTESGWRPAAFLGTSSDRIGSPEGEQAYYVTVAKSLDPLPVTARRRRRPLADDEAVAGVEAPPREVQVRTPLEDPGDVRPDRIAIDAVSGRVVLEHHAGRVEAQNRVDVPQSMPEYGKSNTHREHRLADVPQRILEEFPHHTLFT